MKGIARQVSFLVLLILFVSMLAECANYIGFRQYLPKEEIQASEILYKIKSGQPVEYQDVIIKGDLDLNSRVVLPPISITYSEIDGKFYAQGTLFKNLINFENTTFKGDTNFEFSIFNGTAIFLRSRFAREVWFGNSKFTKGATFNDSIFSTNVEFGSVEFGEDAYFVNSKFNGTADFRLVAPISHWLIIGRKMSIIVPSNNFSKSNEFSGDANFDDAEFNGIAYFTGMQFIKSANFRRTKFSEDANFDDAEFNGTAYFTGNQFRKATNFRGAKFREGADFNGSKFTGTNDFKNSVFLGFLDLTGANFDRLDIYWPSSTRLVCNDGPTYLELIKNFRDLEEYEVADEVYYEYRQWRQREKSVWDTSKYIDILGWITCGYGVRVNQTVTFASSIFVIFGAIYSIIGWLRWRKDGGNVNLLKLIKEYFLLSLIILISAPGELYPLGVQNYKEKVEQIRYWPILERLVGWGILLLLINTLSRVMIRY